MFNKIPPSLYKNKIAEAFDELRMDYGKLTRQGVIYGLMAVDQDAKVIAVNDRFDKDINFWDLSSIGAALYGVARQGQDFFEADYLKWATIIYNNLRLFVQSIGKVSLSHDKRRDILVIVLADKDVNIGTLLWSLKKFSNPIKNAIEADRKIKDKLKLAESDFKKHVQELKNEIFGNKKAITFD